MPYGDAEALARELERLGADELLRRRLGQAARRRFLERFPMERMVAETRRVYEQALAGEA